MQMEVGARVTTSGLDAIGAVCVLRFMINSASLSASRVVLRCRQAIDKMEELFNSTVRNPLVIQALGPALFIGTSFSHGIL